MTVTLLAWSLLNSALISVIIIPSIIKSSSSGILQSTCTNAHTRYALYSYRKDKVNKIQHLYCLLYVANGLFSASASARPAVFSNGLATGAAGVEGGEPNGFVDADGGGAPKGLADPPAGVPAAPAGGSASGGNVGSEGSGPNGSGAASGGSDGKDSVDAEAAAIFRGVGAAATAAAAFKALFRPRFVALVLTLVVAVATFFTLVVVVAVATFAVAVAFTFPRVCTFAVIVAGIPALLLPVASAASSSSGRTGNSSSVPSCSRSAAWKEARAAAAVASMVAFTATNAAAASAARLAAAAFFVSAAFFAASDAGVAATPCMGLPAAPLDFTDAAMLRLRGCCADAAAGADAAAAALFCTATIADRGFGALLLLDAAAEKGCLMLPLLAAFFGTTIGDAGDVATAKYFGLFAVVLLFASSICAAAGVSRAAAVADAAAAALWFAGGVIAPSAIASYALPESLMWARERTAPPDENVLTSP